jgi:tRNA (guanosine-2'-O-)-methyltransferase
MTVGTVETWLARYDPRTVVEALAPFLSEERRQTIESVLSERLGSLTVVLENLHDPHNGAAALRSIEAFGLGDLHLIETASAFRFSSKVTQGCEKWVTLHRHPDPREAAERLRAHGFLLAGAVPEATLPLGELDPSRPLALVFGNEHAGLTPATRAACDLTFGIPMQGMTRSLNLSVSVALVVHDLARRRRIALGARGDLSDEVRLRLRARFYALSVDDRSAESLVRKRLKVEG